jgi:K+-sensing histidine kinase KdpD
MGNQQLNRLRSAERSMIIVRWFAAGFALVQVLTYYRPYPGGVKPVALVLVGALVLANAFLIRAYARWTDLEGARRLAFLALAIDFVAIFCFVFVYTFDVETAMWALVYILPLEGAIRFQRVGALGAMAAATVAYTLREYWGSVTYSDHPFQLTSISFRMGIGLIIGAVAGAMSSRLVRERDRVETLYTTSRALASTLDERQVLQSLTRSACEAVRGRSAIFYRPEDGGLRAVAAHNAPALSRGGAAGGYIAPDNSISSAMKAFREGRIVWSGDVVAVPVPEAGQERESILEISFAGVPHPSREEENSLEGLAEAAAVALAHATAYGHEREAAEELRRLQELRTKFLAMIAHDLRTPLTIIRGVAGTLRRAGESLDRDKQEQMLSSVERQVDRVNRLVGDLLDLARLEVGRLEVVPEPVRLLSVVRAALNDLPGAEVVRIDIPEDLEVMADPQRLMQMVINLVSNSLRHGAPPIEVSGHEDEGGVVVLEIADQGEGLPADRIESPFEAFSPSGAEGSLGLGLAIVRGLAEAQGGRIVYEHNTPHGARFICSLQVASAGVQPEAPDREPMPSSPRSSG